MRHDWITRHRHCLRALLPAGQRPVPQPSLRLVHPTVHTAPRLFTAASAHPAVCGIPDFFDGRMPRPITFSMDLFKKPPITIKNEIHHAKYRRNYMKRTFHNKSGL
ncbi:hypothetical protein ABL840_19115 [Variovorax sp. NFACC27]|uniref:hypothetical protein n=1 Tax=unclassified Variovorax TaxID=663243 RepID=UPI00115FE216